MNILLLCGGSGRRLWPLSNEVRSKQFIEILRTEDGGRESMLQRIVRQLKAADPDCRITFATSEPQVAAIRKQVGEQVPVSAEPGRRDTFPAIALAAQYLSEVRETAADEPVIICPVDSFTDADYYEALKRLDAELRKNTAELLLLGVQPTDPSDRYGYILPKEEGALSPVAEFREKPEKKEAEALIADGALWNCGVFAARLGTILKRAHEVLSFEDYQDLLQRYEEQPAVSFDRAFVEQEKNAAVLRFEGAWKKLDTWENLVSVMSANDLGNAHLNDDCEDVFVLNELDLPVLCLGLKDVIVSASPEGILVTDRKQSAEIKPMVDDLAPRIMFAEKDWGSYQILDVQSESTTIRATIHAGHRMDYHSHEHRDEVWTILSGTGRTVVDGMEQPVSAGDVITMQAGCRHTIIAETEIRLIEVQLGREISVNDKHEFELED